MSNISSMIAYLKPNSMETNQRLAEFDHALCQSADVLHHSFARGS